MSKFVNLKQRKDESLTVYHEQWLSQLEATKQVWGPLIPKRGENKVTAAIKKNRSKYLACVFLAGVDRDRYETVIQELHNDFQLGVDHYPESPEDMLT